MLTALRDFLLSFSPASVRRNYTPASPTRTLLAATWGGLAQFLLAGLALAAGFNRYFVLRAHQLRPHVGGTNEVAEAGIVIFIAFEYLVHPLSLFMLYLAIEGLLRFAGGLITGEVVPSFLVFLAFKLASLAAHRRQQRRNAALPADTLEQLPDRHIRIASATAKPAWNATITIAVNGEWFEVERVEEGVPPRSFVYVLRPAPPGKILRGFEEYNAASTSTRKISAKPGNTAPLIRK
jgi:hypothetical protein